MITLLVTFSLQQKLSNPDLARFSAEDHKVLNRACNSLKVCTVLGFAAAPELLRLVFIGKLDKAVGEAVATALTAAGRECAANGMFNSAGYTIRKHLRQNFVSRKQFVSVIGVVHANMPDDDACRSRWSAYAFWSRTSRRSKTRERFPDGWVERKQGDTKHLPRFGKPGVRNQDPLAVRYPAALYAEFEDSFYMVGEGTRILRILCEVALCWLAAELGGEDFVHDAERTGEEGLYGPESKAQASLQELSAEVAACGVMSSVFKERRIRIGKMGSFKDF